MTFSRARLGIESGLVLFPLFSHSITLPLSRFGYPNHDNFNMTKQVKIIILQFTTTKKIHDQVFSMEFANGSVETRKTRPLQITAKYFASTETA
jgi:hypothetical protein